MIEIPKVSERILKTLDAADWTIETLADAKPEDLTPIEGIGTTTAWRIIVGARRLDQKRKQKQPVKPDEQWLRPWLGDPSQPPPAGNYTDYVKPDPPGLMDMSIAEMEAKFTELAPGQQVPEMAVRVKRNWLRERLRELM